MSSNKSVRVAILDDYQNVAHPIFSQRTPSVELHAFPDTLNVLDEDQRRKLIERLKGFEVISTMRERTAFPPDVLESLPDLKVILTTGMANAAISLKTCADRGILVVGTPGKKIKKPASTPILILSPSLQATAEQTLALILGVAKLIPRNAAEISQGGWQTGLTSGLAGKTLGLLGFGKIGSMVGRMAVFGFGMNLLAWSSNLTQDQAEAKAKELGIDPSVVKVAGSKMELFQQSDIISLHYVLSDRSRGIVGKEELAAMKPSGVLINTSRGGLIDEQELLRTLKKGSIRGVGLDVFTTEPIPANSEWRTTRWGENGTSYAVLAPHMGYADENVIAGWYEESADALAEWLEGRTPAGVIS